MNVLKWLDDLKKDIDKIENKKYELEQWESIAEGMNGRGEGERVQSTSTGDSLPTAVIKKMGISESLEVLKARLAAKIALLERLPAEEYDLMHKIYVQDFTFKQYRRMKKRGSTWTTDKHNSAKMHLQGILNEEYGGGE